MVIHEPFGVAVHAQPVPVVIKTELVRAVAGALVLAGVKEYVQAGAAAWSIVTVAPAMVMVPVEMAVPAVLELVPVRFNVPGPNLVRLKLPVILSVMVESLAT